MKRPARTPKATANARARARVQANRVNRRQPPVEQLRQVMAILRSPTGCPWDREQDHRTLRFHAVEEVYELMDAIEAGDDHEMLEELGDLLLQVIFHAQLARERKAFDFDAICRNIVDKLIRRHPHVFGDSNAKTVDAVWAQWEQIKKVEKHGTRHHRPSALDGIPRHLPALLRAEKLAKKARKAGLPSTSAPPTPPSKRGRSAASATSSSSRKAIGQHLFALAAEAQAKGWSAEELLREATAAQEKVWRLQERRAKTSNRS